MRFFLASALALACVGFGAFAADDVAGAVVVSVKAIDRGAKTAAVKTAEGTEYTIHFAGSTIEHGAKATATGSKDAFQGLKEGDEVIIHYTEKGAVKTADEVDHIGKDGLKASVIAVKSVDRGAKTVTVKTADGAEETYHLTDRAMKETAKGVGKAGKVTIYYTDDAGKKIAHYFKEG
jgi:hypothetical protein